CTVARTEEEACRSLQVNKDHIHNNVHPRCEGSSVSKQNDDVYDYLWDNNIALAEETLHADFLNHMQDCSLEAERYVKFLLQDIIYLQEVTVMLKEMTERVREPEDLRHFMTGRYMSYKNFTMSCLQQFSITEPSFITPTEPIQNYLSTYRAVMEKDPIFFSVALLPCSRLWPWLAQHLQTPESCAYYTWKKDNMHGDPEKHYRAILNRYLNTTEKVQKANLIFRTQMQNEQNFFTSS
ncbi:hypothetical protein NFI96_014422, partial [Prochilodus magdalenae]